MTDKKCVWIINFFAGTPDTGWGERHYYFSKYFKENNIDVTIISATFNHLWRKLPPNKHKFNFEVNNGIKFCWVKTPKYDGQSVWRFWSMLVFAFRSYFVPVKQAGKPDVIIISSMPIFPVLTAHLLKKKYKAARLIFEIRDLWPLTAMYLGNLSKNHPVVRFIGWFEKFGYKKSDYIVSLLPNADKYINQISKAPEKFKYIPNGLDESVLGEEDLSEEIRSKIPKDKFIIGYTGTIGLANALEYFVEAGKLLKNEKDIALVIVGDGYLKQSLIESAKGYDNIIFLEKIKKNQVQNMISNFDVCFVGRNNTPLFEHGVSANKYFDYMLAEKPILDSNNFIKDPVEMSGCGIIVKPDSAEAIKEGALKFYNMSKAERDEIGKKGKVYLLSNHSLKKLAGDYIKLF